MSRMNGRQVLVVGATSGIGLATARALASEGARVALSARRVERLDAEVAALGAQHIAVPCDVRDAEACKRAVAQAVDGLGGLTDFVYTAGSATLSNVADATSEQWRQAFEINVVGPSLLTSAALPHLAKSRGRALYVSTVASEDRPPRRGLALYSATKAALNRLIESWQEEERAVGFTRVTIGDTHGTEMAKDWDPAATGEIVREWVAKGFLYGRTMAPEDVALHLVDLLALRETVPFSSLIPRYPEP